MSNIASRWGALFVLLFVSGCVTGTTLAGRYSLSDNLAVSNGFKKYFLKTARFNLTVYSRIRQIGLPIHIYIEGDGVSWVSRTQLSEDPTPYEPLVLGLASVDTAENVAYIARPGQYSATGVPSCDPSYWSNKRFSNEVIESMNEAIGYLAAQAGTHHIYLVGYSGGAAVAVLVAARRHDIDSLETIAGNLDPQAVNRYHNVSPLEGSLSPMDVTQKIKNIPQRHFAGSADTVVPLFIIESFVRKEGDKDDMRITIIDGVSHTKGWQEQWRRLLTK
jgi:hypothetical protein